MSGLLLETVNHIPNAVGIIMGPDPKEAAATFEIAAAVSED
jgi:hypothetical protein